jgi:DNA-binding transcriptional MocR family regulator
MVEAEQYQRHPAPRAPRRTDPHGITGRTAREIAASAEAAIREGLVETGEPLPTVRALASALGTSPATVNSAYRILRQRGLVIAEGRRGTRVAPRPALRAPQRPSLRPTPSPRSTPSRRDLSVGLPDPALLPELGPALARVDSESYPLEALDRGLFELAKASYEADGVAADAIAVVGGALDAVERVLHAHLRPGDRVVIEDPAYPSIRDILMALGLVAIPAAVDERGIIPAALEASLAKGADAVVAVPRAQNPLGAALDDERAAELRALLRTRPDVLLVEDDHAGIVAGAPFVSLTEPSWPRWAVIRSVSKYLHPDLRVALVAGDETTIARVEGRQALGTRWVSHVLQRTAATLMQDPDFERSALHARDAYAARRAAMIDALAEHGIQAHGRSGLNVWVPVREEAPVVRALYDAGWMVLAGERFRIAAPPGLRITIATLREGEAEEVAGTIGAAEHATRPRQAY